jgi:hypothetical protein
LPLGRLWTFFWKITKVAKRFWTPYSHKQVRQTHWRLSRKTPSCLHKLAIHWVKKQNFWHIFRRKYFENHNTGPCRSAGQSSGYLLSMESCFSPVQELTWGWFYE